MGTAMLGGRRPVRARGGAPRAAGHGGVRSRWWAVEVATLDGCIAVGSDGTIDGPEVAGSVREGE